MTSTAARLANNEALQLSHSHPSLHGSGELFSSPRLLSLPSLLSIQVPYLTITAQLDHRITANHSHHPFPQIQIDTPLAISDHLLNIPFLDNRGSLVSEPTYPYAVRATFLHGSDYLRRDQDGQHVRLEVTSTARDEDNHSLVRFSYTGIVAMDGEEGKVIRGDANATTTGFGNACMYTLWKMSLSLSMLTFSCDLVVQVRFETQDPYLGPLEDKMYVGSGRFIVDPNAPIVVEYKISEVSAACELPPDEYAELGE